MTNREFVARLSDGDPSLSEPETTVDLEIGLEAPRGFHEVAVVLCIQVSGNHGMGSVTVDPPTPASRAESGNG